VRFGTMSGCMFVCLEVRISIGLASSHIRSDPFIAIRPQYYITYRCNHLSNHQKHQDTRTQMVYNHSAFVDAANSPLRIASSDIPLPGANDIIVRNHAVAVNTIDPAQQSSFQVKKWPIVPGHVLAGGHCHLA
jgi:hypothetical protein